MKTLITAVILLFFISNAHAFVKPELNIELNATYYEKNETLGIKMLVLNENNFSINGNLSLKIGEYKEGKFYYADEKVLINQSFSFNNALMINRSLELENFSTGLYKVYGRFYFNETYGWTSKKFAVATNAVTKNNTKKSEEVYLKVDNVSSLSFGSISFIKAEFYAGNLSYERLRFIAYVSEPKKIANDLQEKTIYQSYCYADTGILVENISNYEEIYLTLPLILKSNCDLQYEEGFYTIVVRTCSFKDEKWYYSPFVNEIKAEIINKNETCDKKIEYKEKVEYVNNCSVAKKVETQYELLYYPRAVYVNESIDVFVKLNISGALHSYASNGKTSISDGWNGSAWIKKSTGNAISVNESGVYYLKNRIDEGGNFTLKIIFNNKTIVEEPIEAIKTEIDEKKKEMSNETKIEIGKITGNVVTEKKENLLSRLLNKLFRFRLS